MYIKFGEIISKRPLVMFVIFLVIGILTAEFCSSYALTVYCLILLIICSAAFYFRGKVLLFILAGSAIFCSVGFFEYTNTKNINYNRFNEYSNEYVEITGIIETYPEVKETTISYIVGVRSIKKGSDTVKQKGKILVTVLKNNNSKLIEYGSLISLKGDLTLPKGQRNPGGFNYRSYLAGNGISATVFANQDDIFVSDSLGANLIESAGLSIRNRIIAVVNNSLPLQQAGLLNGMLIGYREGLDKNVRTAFSDSGLMHLMAVSGANIAFIILPLAFLFKKMKIRSRASNSLIIGILILFVYITGFEPSVLRAVVMAFIILLGKIIMRETDIYTSIAFAALIMLLYNPMLIFNIGFQLSYAATLSLVLFFTNIKNMINYKYMPGFVADVLAATLAAQIGVLPISVYHFNQVSLISIVANIIVVPLTQFVTILGFAMVLLGQVSLLLSQLIGYVNCTLLSFILFITNFSAHVPYALLKVPTPSIFAIIIYYLVAVFMLWYKPKFKPVLRLEYYIYTAAIIAVVAIIPAIIPRGLEILFLDVGQGDSIFIRTAEGKTVLIDGGGFSSRTNRETTMGDTVVIPFLLDYGITRLDMVIATHGHDDHIRGLIPVINAFSVSKLIIPENRDFGSEFKDILQDVDQKGISVSLCKRGDIVKLDKSTFIEVLHPKKDYNPVGTSLNNGSLVLRLDYKDTEVLLTGDIEEEVEKMLLEDGIDLRSDILKIAHHGSSTSSSEDFISAVNASAGIISVGKNSFGHPSDRVVERLENKRMEVLRTDRDGGVYLKSDGNNIKILKTVTVGK